MKLYSPDILVRPLSLIFTSFLILLSNGCVNNLPPEGKITMLEEHAGMYPDYTGITIPGNIAPLNFRIDEDGEKFAVFLEGSDGQLVRMKQRSGYFRINARSWKKFISGNSGSSYSIRIFRIEKEHWHEFLPAVNTIAPEPIDPYVAYRLIPPGYETWSSMGLYQRDLTSFKEYPVIENRYIEENCVNCHSFGNGNPEQMMFHIRGSMGGTMIKKGKRVEKVNLKREETLSAGVYPSWHPSGDYIAYSTNKIEQYFYARPENSIEVLDRHSDLIIYNSISGEVFNVPGTKGDDFMETYPNWSPDGQFLYFSRTNAQQDTPFDSIRYDICRMAFDPETARFGKTETILRVTDRKLSASFPRVSPDGNYLLCTVHNYGTFPIWHKEADLCLVNLENGTSDIPGIINSGDSDSFHSWSSNSRWIIFSSRRQDGQYTKLYISYLDREGHFHKPFLLPAKDPGFYEDFFYSYNVPELVTGKIPVSEREWIKYARQD